LPDGDNLAAKDAPDEAPIFSRVLSNIALEVNDRRLSKRERDRFVFAIQFRCVSNLADLWTTIFFGSQE
jgi:hypothetical protein